MYGDIPLLDIASGSRKNEGASNQPIIYYNPTNKMNRTFDSNYKSKMQKYLENISLYNIQSIISYLRVYA